MRWHPRSKESQRRYNPIAGFCRRHIPPLAADAQGRQTEARRCNAGYDATVGLEANVAPVLNKPGLRICLFPKISERCPLEFIEKRVVLGREGERFGPEFRRTAMFGFVCRNS